MKCAWKSWVTLFQESPKADVMGKLKADMMFLERMATEPSLGRDLLDPQYRGRGRAGILSTARDGLSFLKVRSSFWETSGNTNIEGGKRL